MEINEIDEMYELIRLAKKILNSNQYIQIKRMLYVEYGLIIDEGIEGVMGDVANVKLDTK